MTCSFCKRLALSDDGLCLTHLIIREQSIKRILNQAELLDYKVGLIDPTLK